MHSGEMSLSEMIDLVGGEDDPLSVGDMMITGDLDSYSRRYICEKMYTIIDLTRDLE